MNQIGVSLRENVKFLKEVNWEYVYDKTRVTVHGVPVAVNAISYGLLLKSYMKYVHNKPLPIGKRLFDLEKERALRNRHLALFA